MRNLKAVLFFIFSVGCLGEDQFVRIGNNVTLVCPYTGNVLWTYIKGGTIIINQGLTINPKLPNKDRYSIVGISTGYRNLHIIQVTESEKGNYECASGNKSTKIHLKVYVNPNFPSILNSVQNGSRMLGIEGQVFTMTCDSRGGNPPAEVTWLRGQTTLQTGQDSTSYTWTPVRADDKTDYICQSNSTALVTPLTTTVQLYLSLKPMQPTLTYPEVKENTEMAVTCLSTGSRPAALLSLIFRRTEQSAVSPQQNTSDTQMDTFTVSSKYRLQVNRSDNGQPLTCTARNSASLDGISSTQNVSVSFGPDRVSISGSRTLNENTLLSVRCRASSSNPQSTIVWFKNGNQFTPNTQIMTSDGDDNGRITYQDYSATVRKEDNKANITCRASASAGSAVNYVILDVRFRPRVQIQPSRWKAIVGDLNVQLMCSVNEANPGVQSYIWTKGTQTLTGQSSQAYTISSISPLDNGSYKCQAVNIVGTSEAAKAVLEVLYAPVIAHLLDQFPEEGTRLEVTCSINASNPNPNSIYWTRDNDDRFRVNGTTLTIFNISRTQAGVHKCHAENIMVSSAGVSRTGTSQQTMAVNVLYGPGNSIGLSPSNRTIAMEESESNVIPIVSCSAICNPQCKYSWSGPSPSSTGKLTLGKSERKKNGTYTCTANNKINGHLRQTTIQLDVLIYYKAEIKSIEVLGGPVHNERSEVSISCTTDSYPAAQITWTSSGHRQSFTEITNHSNILRLSKVSCYDTANYTCTAFNGFGTSVFKQTSLFIQCAARLPEGTADTVNIGISTGENLNISATFLAYPRPEIMWYFKTNDTDILLPTQPSIEEKDVNLFQSNLVKELKDQRDFGIYIVKASNKISLSQSNQNFIVEAKRAPDSPINASVTCKDKVTVSWTSAFNGGADQEFTVYYGEDSPTVPSSKVPDTNNKGKVLSTTIENLTPGTLYFFEVRATNLYGSSEMDYLINCTTASPTQPPTSQVVAIAAGVSGAIVSAVIVIVAVLILLKYRKVAGQKKETSDWPLTENKQEADDGDGIKDNILYVSAGPSLSEPNNMYAEVNKPKKSNGAQNTSDVYAVVEKPPKKGKEKKGKRKQQKEGTGDVYENVTEFSKGKKANEAVYSNSTSKEERGTRNQDGLLYVEVDLRPVPEERRNVIIGEEERTDYASVDFILPETSAKK